MKRLERPIEIAAVITGLLYTWLLIQGSIWCWAFALISALLFFVLVAYKRLYAESVLQLFYVGTGILGFLNWGENGGELHAPLSWEVHLAIIGAATALTLVSGYLLKNLTDAVAPLLDSFTTVFSIFATLLMIYLIPENWWYWIVIDAVSVALYVRRGLYITAMLFLLYTGMAVMGLLTWMQA